MKAGLTADIAFATGGFWTGGEVIGATSSLATTVAAAGIGALARETNVTPTMALPRGLSVLVTSEEVAAESLDGEVCEVE